MTERSGACVGYFKGGVFFTPDLGSGILPSITRTVVMDLLRESLGVVVIERPLERSEFGAADEVIFMGTSAEVLPILSVDSFPIGDAKIGELTTRLRTEYEGVVRGERPTRERWLSPVWPAGRVDARR